MFNTLPLWMFLPAILFLTGLGAGVVGLLWWIFG